MDLKTRALSFLSSQEKAVPTLVIAKACIGPKGTKKHINPTLYALAKENKVVKETEEEAFTIVKTQCEKEGGYAYINMIKEALVRILRRVLVQLNWPKPIECGEREHLKSFALCFAALLRLQKLHSCNERLWAFEVLFERLRISFRYHFNGRRLTNRVARPEFFYLYVLDQIRRHAKFVKTLQPILTQCGFIHTIAVHVFITGLLVDIKTKIKTDTAYLDDDGLFLHWIHEAMHFEHTLAEQYAFCRGHITHMIIENPAAFTRWLRLESVLAHTFMSTFFKSTPFNQQRVVREYPVAHSAIKLCDMLLLVESRAATGIYSFSRRRTFIKMCITPLIARYADAMNRAAQTALTCPPVDFTTVCTLMNTVFYLRDVLFEWSGTLFYAGLAMAKPAFDAFTVQQKRFQDAQHKLMVVLVNVLVDELKKQNKHPITSVSFSAPVSPSVAEAFTVLRTRLFVICQCLHKDLARPLLSRLSILCQRRLACQHDIAVWKALVAYFQKKICIRNAKESSHVRMA